MNQPDRAVERILNLLESSGRAVSAQDIYMELRNRNKPIGLATVYRCLDSLKLSGFVQVETHPYSAH